MRRLEILYEHPEWFRGLFAELNRRRIPFGRVHAQQLCLDPEEGSRAGELIVNRMSPSAWRRGHANAIFAVREYLRHAEARGAAVVNGSAAYEVEISKARQVEIFRSVGVGYPRTRVINHPEQAVRAAVGLRFPVLVKPNIGGSGAGIARFDTAAQLAGARLELGLDSTALVQEFVPAREGSITRIEVLNGEMLYAIRITTDFAGFNLCPATMCCASGAGGKLRVERVEPPAEAVAAALKLVREAQIDIGGIEYLVDDRDRRLCFYDINALSNFVADAPKVVGFDPTARFVDYLEARLRA